MDEGLDPTEAEREDTAANDFEQRAVIEMDVQNVKPATLNMDEQSDTSYFALCTDCLGECPTTSTHSCPKCRGKGMADLKDVCKQLGWNLNRHYRERVPTPPVSASTKAMLQQRCSTARQLKNGTLTELKIAEAEKRAYRASLKADAPEVARGATSCGVRSGLARMSAHCINHCRTICRN